MVLFCVRICVVNNEFMKGSGDYYEYRPPV